MSWLHTLVALAIAAIVWRFTPEIWPFSELPVLLPILAVFAAMIALDEAMRRWGRPHAG